jgi:hypothetical protein
VVHARGASAKGFFEVCCLENQAVLHLVHKAASGIAMIQGYNHQPCNGATQCKKTRASMSDPGELVPHVVCWALHPF